jgi:hypothetical protein
VQVEEADCQTVVQANAVRVELPILQWCTAARKLLKQEPELSKREAGTLQFLRKALLFHHSMFDDVCVCVCVCVCVRVCVCVCVRVCVCVMRD